MKQKLIIGVVVVIIVVGALWAMTNKKSAPNDSPANTKNTNGIKDAKTQSLKALMAANTLQECTFQNATDSSTSEGKVYLAKGMMRGDFTSTSGGQTFTSHMITKDGTVYTWIDNMTTGFKISADENAQAKTDDSQKQGVDINQELNYNCKPWSADNSIFELPANITFNDLNAIMKPKLDASASAADKNAQCSACDQVPEGPSREQCRTALGCT